jgi:predicted 3-demethylubiquinone-9 3-methyltransferase (glyoxalase superfamily)
VQKITPFLWFNDQAEEAMNLYVSIFKNSSIKSITRYGDAMPDMKGKVLTAVFELDGQELMAIDGGPQFSFTEAISLQVSCASQEEVDAYWNALTAGGEESQCGWLKDKFGLSWQITPKVLPQLLQDPDPKIAKRVMQAMLQMKKIDIAALEAARDQA